MTGETSDVAASLVDHLDQVRERERAELENDLARQQAADDRAVEALIARTKNASDRDG